MYNNHKKFGTYYGTLIEAKDSEIWFDDCNDDETKNFINKLYEIGVFNIYFDVCDENTWSDTLFFEINDKTDLKELMLLTTKLRPHEFDEISNNCFRMWFD